MLLILPALQNAGIIFMSFINSTRFSPYYSFAHSITFQFCGIFHTMRL